MKIQILKKIAFDYAINYAKLNLLLNDKNTEEEWLIEKERLETFIEEAEKYMKQKHKD